MKLTIIMLIAAFSVSSYALTDYQCVTDCVGEGNMYGLCQRRCSDNSFEQQQQQFKVTDFRCMQDCQKRGYMYALCSQKCSY